MLEFFVISAVLLVLGLIVMAIVLALTQQGEWLPPHDADVDDAAQQEMLDLVLRTGRPHVANRRPDGTWEIKEAK